MLRQSKAHSAQTIPVEYEFINRGVGGSRVTDLYARIKFDLINLKQDVLSILIGVNDVWHEVDRQDGVCAEKFFNVYCALIEEVKAALPNVRIMIMEPYVMKGTATEEKWDEFKPEVKLRAEKARAVAQKYDLEFIPLQCIFDAPEKLCPVSYWLRDGVHPTNMGHELIKRAWLKAFRNE